jgi:hypothetical protein
MARKRKTARQLYATKQVAAILDVAEWRVKNFSEGGAYGLPPSQTVGSGRGSRRLYGAMDICRLAIANELVNCGFTPETVGRAVREIPESLLLESLYPYHDDDEEQPEEPEEGPPMLVYMYDTWKVREGGTFDEALKHHFANFQSVSHGIFILNLWSLVSGVREKLEALRDQSKVVVKGD